MRRIDTCISSHVLRNGSPERKASYPNMIRLLAGMHKEQCWRSVSCGKTYTCNWCECGKVPQRKSHCWRGIVDYFRIFQDTENKTTEGAAAGGRFTRGKGTAKDWCSKFESAQIWFFSRSD